MDGFEQQAPMFGNGSNTPNTPNNNELSMNPHQLQAQQLQQLPMSMQGYPRVTNGSNAFIDSGPSGILPFHSRSLDGGRTMDPSRTIDPGRSMEPSRSMYPAATVSPMRGGGSIPLDSYMSEIFGRGTHAGVSRSTLSFQDAGDSMVAGRNEPIDLTRRRAEASGPGELVSPYYSGRASPRRQGNRRFNYDMYHSDVGTGMANQSNNYCRETSSLSSSQRVSTIPPSQQLQVQKRKLLELEQMQLEVEMRKQQILAGIQETLSASSAAMTPAPANRSQSGGGNQQWTICQVCFDKAFASQEEAIQHEAICLQTSRKSQSSDSMTSLSVAEDSMKDQEEIEAELGPFRTLESPLPLAMETDRDWLTPLHCFVRQKCVEVFCTTEDDVAAPSRGQRRPVQVGQVGIRCPHCNRDSTNSNREREPGSVYYPTTISNLYNATMNLLQRHLHCCSAVPPELMQEYLTLKEGDGGRSASKRYWIESALSLGLVDTPTGIRVSARTPPPLPGRQPSPDPDFSQNKCPDDFMPPASAPPKTNSEQSQQYEVKVGAENPNEQQPPVVPPKKSIFETGLVVEPEDKQHATQFSYTLLSQMQPCSFTEADRLGKRKGLPPGFAGLACRHCFGTYGSGRFFPSTLKTLSDTSKTLNVLHNHMTKCRKCPQEVRDTLDKLRKNHDEERKNMKFGSQKAFFAKIWTRLHGNIHSGGVKRKASTAAPTAPSFSHLGQLLHPINPMTPMMQFQSGGMGHQGMASQGMGGVSGMNAPMMGLDMLARQAESPPESNKRQRTYV